MKYKMCAYKCAHMHECMHTLIHIDTIHRMHTMHTLRTNTMHTMHAMHPYIRTGRLTD